MNEEKTWLEAHSTIYEEGIAYGAEEQVNRLNAEFTLSRIEGPVIELGCGNGTWTKHLIEKFGSVTVVDASESLLDKLSKLHGSKVECHEALFEDYVPQSKDHKTVLLIGALHHVDDPPAVLRRITEWLGSNAKLVVSVPNAYSIHRRLGQAMSIVQKTDEISVLGAHQGHRRTYTPELFRKHLTDAGLTVEFSCGLFFKPFSNAQLDNLENEVFEGLFRLSLDLPEEYCAVLYAECNKSS